MELGVVVYFLIVFGFGGLLLLGLIVYFLREFVIRHDHPAWSTRTLKSKVVLLSTTLLTAALIFVPVRMIWVTRVAAIPGRYAADGVWGNSTLEMQPDGNFCETWHFKNEYTGKTEGDGSMQGQWHNKRRDWFTRDIVLEHFTPLAEYDRGQSGGRSVIVEGYSGTTVLDVDPGANIVFFKQR
jgi:hypothetical protein